MFDSSKKCLVLLVSLAALGPAWGGYAVGTVTGSGMSGYADGPIPEAQFINTSALAQDSQGNLYVADAHRIRRIAPDGKVSTLTGTPQPGYSDGPADSARFNQISGLWLLPGGDLLISDSWNHRIRKLSKDGMVTTVAGSGPTGYPMGGHRDGSADSARFNNPLRLVADSVGNIYVVDLGDNRLRRIDAAGRVTTLAGDGGTGFRDGPADSARFNQIFGLALGPGGVIYIADKANNRIRKWENGVVSTVADPDFGLREPCDVALDSAGGLVVAGQLNNKIYRIHQGKMETLAGSVQGYQDGAGAQARFHAPQTLLLGQGGIIYVGEYRGLRIRRLYLEKPDCIEGRFEGCWTFALSNRYSGRLCLSLERDTFTGFVIWNNSTWGRVEGQWSGDTLEFDLSSNTVPKPDWVGHYLGTFGLNGFSLQGDSDTDIPLENWAASRDLENPTSLSPQMPRNRHREAPPYWDRIWGPSGLWFDLRGRMQ